MPTFHVLAIDRSGNRGLLSNIIPVIVVKEEDNEIIPEETTTETSAALPRSAITNEETAAYVWAPVLALILLSLFLGTLWVIYKRNYPAKEYNCDEEKSNESWSQDENRSTTTSAGVSTNLTIEDDLSIMEHKMDIWSTESTSPSSVIYGTSNSAGVSTNLNNMENNLHPRIHIIEDLTTYRNLSTINDEFEYSQLDQILSTLLASKQIAMPQHQKHNESLV